MDRRRVLAVARLAFVGLAIVAIVAQLLDLAIRGVLNPVNFFSYFTIQSNLIAIAALALPALAVLTGRSTRFDMLRGAAVVYMTVTGVVSEWLRPRHRHDCRDPRRRHRPVPRRCGGRERPRRAPNASRAAPGTARRLSRVSRLREAGCG